MIQFRSLLFRFKFWFNQSTQNQSFRDSKWKKTNYSTNDLFTDEPALKWFNWAKRGDNSIQFDLKHFSCNCRPTSRTLIQSDENWRNVPFLYFLYNHLLSCIPPCSMEKGSSCSYCQKDPLQHPYWLYMMNDIRYNHDKDCSRSDHERLDSTIVREIQWDFRSKICAGAVLDCWSDSLYIQRAWKSFRIIAID